MSSESKQTTENIYHTLKEIWDLQICIVTLHNAILYFSARTVMCGVLWCDQNWKRPVSENSWFELTFTLKL